MSHLELDRLIFAVSGRISRMRRFGNAWVPIASIVTAPQPPSAGLADGRLTLSECSKSDYDPRTPSDE